MISTSEQQQINEREWANPDNWSTIYFSKKDSRSAVPKKNPKHGTTINFGHPKGARWIYYLMAIFFFIGTVIGASIAWGILKA